jgi:hypothetical protein
LKILTTSRFLPVVSIILLLQATSCRKDSSGPVPITRSLQVWLHRVNTIEKAQHFQDSYSGFELDVHFDTCQQTFIVKHDAADTSTLTLPVWLGSVDKPERLGYWLDFKNLCSENGDAALNELLRIRQAFNLTNHPIVVESGFPPALVAFDTLNFRTSYYIPWSDPGGITTVEEETWKNYIQGYLSSTGIETISGYYHQHDLMQRWFPGVNKLLWYLDSYDPAVKDSIIVLTKKDATVEVLLVGEDYP